MISTALRAAAAYVDDNASGTAWDRHQQLTDEQRFAKSEKIKAVAGELRALADATEAQKLRYGEFEAQKDRLYAFGVSLPSNIAPAVAAAFRDAEGPSQPREKGWLKPA